MKIKCTNCGYIEKTDKDFFVKLIGGAMPVGGFWAWTTYLFAGTGFAMAIVVAIIGGGVAMLIFKDEIVEWIINKDYKCPECGKVKWQAYDSDKEEVKSSSVTEEEHIEKSINMLRSKGYEFEREGNGWLVLEPSGDLKEIHSYDELMLYTYNSLKNYYRSQKKV